MGERIYHVSLVSDWDEAAASDEQEYRMSTIGRTLADEGFIHFSRAGAQLAGVADRFYGDVREPLCLLEIDTARLTTPIVDEAPGLGATELFPHLYAALPVDAVVSVTALVRADDGALGPLA